MYMYLQNHIMPLHQNLWIFCLLQCTSYILFHSLKSCLNSKILSSLRSHKHKHTYTNIHVQRMITITALPMFGFIMLICTVCPMLLLSHVVCPASLGQVQSWGDYSCFEPENTPATLPPSQGLQWHWVGANHCGGWGQKLPGGSEPETRPAVWAVSLLEMMESVLNCLPSGYWECHNDCQKTYRRNKRNRQWSKS